MVKKPGLRLFKKNTKNNSNNALKPLQRLSLYFFKRPRKTALIWLIIAVFGILSYTTLLKREGFPSINTPFALAQGTYLVNDASRVDKEVSKPLSDFLLTQDGVKTVETTSQNNFFMITVAYKQDVDALSKSAQLQKEIEQKGLLPKQADVKLEAYKFGFTLRGDELVVSFYSKDKDVSTEELAKQAEQAAAFIKSKNLSTVEDVSIINPYETAENPVTGKPIQTQKTFDRYGERVGENNEFHKSIVVGINARDGVDNLKLNDEVQSAVNELNSDPKFTDFQATISASTAPQIIEQVNELQRTLLEGLLAVLVVGSIVIAIRASIITVLAMSTVVIAVNGFLFLIDYSLNTITLFALILGLSLIVDDTIIMVEAIDSQRRRQKKASKAITEATGKISRAMLAATMTAALSFVPLLFVGGILGSFIRAIPITIILALFTSLLVALIFIPLFARFLLLGKKQMGEGNVHEIAAGAEAGIARFIGRPMLWARNSRKKLVSVGIVALLIGFGFIGASGFLFQKVTFNIFPNSKDTNQLSITLKLPPGTDINEAQDVVDKADAIVAQTIGTNFKQASYYGQADMQTAILTIDITDYKKRDIKAPQIVDELEAKFAEFKYADAQIGQIDAGPPAAAFGVRVDTSQNREQAIRLSDDIMKFLETTELKRPDGSVAKIKNVSVSNPDVFNRAGGKPYVEVSATFEDTDTTTLVTVAQKAVEKEFPKERVASYGVGESALSYNFGQEDENQDSFKTLALAFPAVLVAIFILLSIQFRSLVQPLLIFMAIPFSLFGITLGLYLTDNAFSFFSMLGFFALIGLSIKNTILLTDYANQARRAGKRPVDAAHEALLERFRPLIATSLTAVVSLIPLAITSPFWEGLAVTLMFGLLSSTLLVITVFPYYYLGAEFMRMRIRRRDFLLWLILSILSAVALSTTGLKTVAILGPIAVTAGMIVYRRTRRSQVAQ